MSLNFVVSKLFRRFESPFEVHNRIEVSGSALRSNLNLYRRATQLQVMPVLKGNAYGHGIEQVAEALRSEQMPYIAVDGYFEALRIRNISRQPVLVMGAIKASNYARMKYDDFTFVVQDVETVKALGRTGKHIKVHVEINSGMNRYGVKVADLNTLTSVILSYKNLELEGVMSHLADADGTDSKTVASAVKIFDDAVEAVLKSGAKPKWLHVAQTAGSKVSTSRYANAIRLGIGLYGVDPFPSKSPHAMDGLRPVLRLVSTITKVIHLKKGDKVGYNYTFTAPNDMSIAILPLGYYEGVNRALSNVGNVSIAQTLLPIVGRVCMNHTMVNLEGSGATLHDEVVVYSDVPSHPNSISSIAKQYGLFNYNILTALSPDIRRQLKD